MNRRGFLGRVAALCGLGVVAAKVAEPKPKLNLSLLVMDETNRPVPVKVSYPEFDHLRSILPSERYIAVNGKNLRESDAYWSDKNFQAEWDRLREDVKPKDPEYIICSEGIYKTYFTNPRHANLKVNA